MTHIIVGIDTGKTSAVACIDLDGNLLHIAHKRNGGIKWIVDSIRNAGTPIIIANDKHARTSSLIKKVNASFCAMLYTPEHDISMYAKRHFARRMSIGNPHERDAYISARKAYNAHANKLNQVERIARKNNFADIDAMKAKVIGRHSAREVLENRNANRR